MNFKNRKLPKEAAADLRRCPIESVEPHALMIAPVYVFMRKNEKFIAVKSPLDFFTAEELERMKTLELFFMPAFVDSVLPYRDLARRTKLLLNWTPVDGKVEMPPTPYELSDAVLRITAPLWGMGLQIEPFFISVFVNELCALLPGEEMAAAREKDLVQFERAIFLSAWVVFLSLHLGATNLPFLDRLRVAVFRKITGIDRQGENVSALGLQGDFGELLGILERHLGGRAVYRPLGVEFFEARSERVAQKIVARIKRIRAEVLIGINGLEGTVYGDQGFVEGGAE